MFTCYDDAAFINDIRYHRKIRAIIIVLNEIKHNVVFMFHNHMNYYNNKFNIRFKV